MKLLKVAFFVFMLCAVLSSANSVLADESTAPVVSPDEAAKQFYDTVYSSCMGALDTNPGLKRSIAKLPPDYLATTCRCGADRIRANFAQDKLMLIIVHSSAGTTETPLQSAYAKSLLATFSELATRSGEYCRQDYLKSHNIKN